MPWVHEIFMRAGLLRLKSLNPGQVIGGFLLRLGTFPPLKPEISKLFQNSKGQNATHHQTR